MSLNTKNTEESTIIHNYIEYVTSRHSIDDYNIILQQLENESKTLKKSNSKSAFDGLHHIKKKLQILLELSKITYQESYQSQYFNTDKYLDKYLQEIEYKIQSELNKDCRTDNFNTPELKNVFDGNVLLACEYKKKNGTNTVDPTGWWASEKFDGYRCIWTGESFISRNGTAFNVPEWFLKIMPPGISLDGEFWMGRGNFTDCGIFRKKTPIDDEWIDVQYKVFDVPCSLNMPFEKRMSYLQDIIKQRTSYMNTKSVDSIKKCPLVYTEQIKVKSVKHLDKIFTDLVNKGGEGVMIRQSGSFYEGKRSKTLLKYKQFYDAECVITGYKPGTGKYENMLGSFKCNASIRILDKKKNKYIIKKVPITVGGMTDKIRKDYLTTHPINTIITITYNELSNDNYPRHPRYLRIRDDNYL